MSKSKTSFSLVRPKGGTPLVSPSILAGDVLSFQSESATVEDAGADLHHIDVMDGHFVPNLTFGIPFVSALRKKGKLPLDVHIMVSNPDVVALDYVRAGADILVFHVEAAVHAVRLCQHIREAGARPGIALNPGTSLECARPLLPFVDVVTIMSVNPGFSGQSFISEAIERVSSLAKMIDESGLEQAVAIEVDGGINVETGRSVVHAGASILVAGNFVYGAKNRADAVQALKHCVEKTVKKSKDSKEKK